MRRLMVIGVFALASLVLGAAQGAPPGSGDYIVVLRDGPASPAQIASEHGRAYGFTARFVYSHALRGYAATLPEAALAGIERNPQVLFVAPDREVEATAAPAPCDDLTQCQLISNGVSRIDGDLSSTRSGDGKGTVNINVAVLDDGMDGSHPDLNVVGGTSCIHGQGRPGPAGVPSGWHGTMVGGFIGAIDNAIGRVGVAPGARLWAVRVLHDDAFGADSEVICGLDWVTATRSDSDPSNDIAVANMSLGGEEPFAAGSCPAASPPNAFYLAICRAVEAGVTIVTAAGNEATDIQNIAPATIDDVFAVTAMSDKDGVPGGLGGQLNCLPSELDDSAATFSNFATLTSDQAHTVAAPGSCIGSTYPGGLYAVGSGTSFASPLVAGTVALCIASGPCAGLAPRQIIQKIVSDAAAYNGAKRNSGYGFQGDPLRPISGKYYGYLIRAGLY